VGGIERVTVGSFKAKTKEYFSQELIGDYEITNLIGNISTMKGEIYLHLHIGLSDSKYDCLRRTLDFCCYWRNW